MTFGKHIVKTNNHYGILKNCEKRNFIQKICDISVVKSNELNILYN